MKLLSKKYFDLSLRCFVILEPGLSSSGIIKRTASFNCLLQDKATLSLSLSHTHTHTHTHTLSADGSVKQQCTSIQKAISMCEFKSLPALHHAKNRSVVRKHAARLFWTARAILQLSDHAARRLIDYLRLYVPFKNFCVEWRLHLPVKDK
jgi:hypothetical protein